MLNDWTILQLSKMKQVEAMKDAQRRRLLIKMHTDDGRAALRHREFLNKLGKAMVAYGVALQKRYGT